MQHSKINCLCFFLLVFPLTYQANFPFVFHVDNNTTVRMPFCQHNTQLGEIWNMDISAAGLAI